MDLHAPRLLHNMSQNTKSRDNQEIPFKSTLFVQHRQAQGAHYTINTWKKMVLQYKLSRYT